MKQGIHPDYHPIKVKYTNGQESETYSTWGKEGDTMILDVDIHTHPVWTKERAKIQQTGQVSKFANRYGDFGFAKKPTAPKN